MKKSSIAVIGLFLLLYILPLGVRPIVIPDETRYAEIPREMLATGDWIVPHLNGLRYFEKPVLGYWLNAGSIMLFGENAFAIRFASALATGISALLVFLLIRKFAGGNSAGILSAAALLTCIEVFALGVTSTLDGIFSLFITAAMVSFFFAHMEGKYGKKMIFLLLFGFSCGLAFLTKGFIAFALPVVTIVPFMIWEHRWKELFKVAWVPIIAATLVSLPWCVMIHLQESDFWNNFFWIEHIRRFISPMCDQHPEPFWLFIPIIIGGALPWTALLPAVILGRNEICLKNSLRRFAICWFLFPFVFFSASQGKLITYILPCFPPLIILITVGLMNYHAKGKKKEFTIAALIITTLSGTAMVVLILSQTTGFFGLRIYSQAETWKWILIFSGLLVWSAFLLLAIRASDFRIKITIFCVAPVLFMFSSHFVMPDQVEKQKAPGAFLLRHSGRVQADTIIVSDTNMVSAACWFYKRDNIFMLNKGELEYGLNCADSRYRMLTVEQINNFVRKNSGKKRLVIITTNKHYTKRRHLFSKPVFEDIDGAFAFAQF